MKTAARKHKVWTFLICGMTAVFLIVGCGRIDGGSENSGVRTGERESYSLSDEVPGNGSAQVGEETVSVRIFDFFGGDEMKVLAEAYSQKYPDIEITVEAGELGDDDGILLNKVMGQLSSGNGPDILLVNRSQLETLQKKGVLAELSEVLPEEVRSQMFKSALRQGTLGEGLYGVAREISVSTLLVPDEIWAGESWSTEDVLKLLEEREREGVPYDRWISLNHSLTAEQMLFDIAVINIGGESSWPVDERQGKCYFNTQEFIRVLEGCKKYGEISGSRGHMTDEECLTEIEEGKAFALSAEGGLQQFSRCLAMCGEGWHCVGYPTDSGQGGRVSCYQFAAINAGTAHYEVATDFLNYLLSEEVQRENYGPATVRRDILTEGIVENHPLFEGVPVFMWGQNVVLLEGKPDGTSYLQEYLELLDQGKLETWRNTEIRSVIMEEAGAFFTGIKSAAEAAEIMQNRVQVYLDERGY